MQSAVRTLVVAVQRARFSSSGVQQTPFLDPFFTVTLYFFLVHGYSRESPCVLDDRVTLARLDQSTTTPVVLTALLLWKTKI